jgi:hypothetical protein
MRFPVVVFGLVLPISPAVADDVHILCAGQNEAQSILLIQVADRGSQALFCGTGNLEFCSRMSVSVSREGKSLTFVSTANGPAFSVKMDTHTETGFVLDGNAEPFLVKCVWN